MSYNQGNVHYEPVMTNQVSRPLAVSVAAPVQTVPVTTSRVVPVQQSVIPPPRQSTIVQGGPPAPVQQSNIGQSSVLYIDDEERYRTFASERFGYGRNKEPRGDHEGYAYNKRYDKRVNSSIIAMKNNTDEYRNDPFCTLI